MRFSVAQLCLAGVAVGAAAPSEAPSFDWDSIKPAKDLEYHDCFDEFKCARLEVPLDWLNKTDTRTAVIAMIKLPAVVPDSDPSFSGSIFTNPGGPGGSGTSFLLRWGHPLRKTADKPGHRHYEIVSFDPRGIGKTTPQSNCYRQNVLGRDVDLAAWTGNGALDRDPASLSVALAMQRNLGQRCKAAEEEWGDAMPFVNTPSVARDMVEMVDKIDELRKRQAVANPSSRNMELKKRGAGHRHDDYDVPRLQYIGFSYGTVLGNYFASLFPGRVGRLILDGVCNIDDYTSGPGWLTNTVDTDEIFKNFISGCHKAGPGACDLAHEGESAKDLSSRVWGWINKLNEEPAAVLQSTAGNSIIITGADVLEVIASVLYKPVPKFKTLATLLEGGVNGNYTLLAETIGDSLPALNEACPVPGNNASFAEVDRAEQQSAVLCGDGDDIADKDLAWWRQYLKKQISQSAVFGAKWAAIRITCSSWPFRPNWSFKGPFTTPEADARGVKGKPAAPLLFLTNRLDPVTPLSAARAMAARHPGAGIVVQEAMGHCAVGAAPSECTRRIVADYFDTGAVPSKETTCETTCGPWDEGCTPFGDEMNSLSSWGQNSEDESVITLRKFPLGLM